MATRVTILGAGPGGYVAAVRAAQLGASVTVVEKEQVGGTCLNWGCIPSKIMKATAEMLEKFHQAEAFGIRTDGSAALDMQLLMARKQKVLATQIKGIEGLLAHHQISLVRGSAHIDGPGRVSATGEDGQVQRWEWDRLIIATGSQPFSVPAFPFDGRQILSSNHILGIENGSRIDPYRGRRRDRLRICLYPVGHGSKSDRGGSPGPHAAPAVGGPRLLKSARAGDEKAQDQVLRQPGGGVDRPDRLKTDWHGDHRPFALCGKLKDKDNVPVTIQVAQALVCIGRSPNTKAIGLSTIGLETDAKGWIAVDDRLQTGVPGVYAIGDVLGPERVMLAHVASTEAMLAAENAMGGDRAMDYTAVPGAIFTMPEVACVGLTEPRPGSRASMPAPIPFCSDPSERPR
jgi:dihydrolipoamide dehydrogenase